MLDINLKQYMREFLEMKMAQARGEATYFNVSPGILIRWDKDHIDLEDFLDEMWVFVTKKNMLDNFTGEMCKDCTSAKCATCKGVGFCLHNHQSKLR